MPLPVESLTPDSNPVTIREAIAQSMEQCMKEGGKDMKECAGMIYGMVREHTGKEMMEGNQR